MTLCPGGWHPFPIEDGTGAYCPVHGITLLPHPDTEELSHGESDRSTHEPGDGSAS